MALSEERLLSVRAGVPSSATLDTTYIYYLPDFKFIYITKIYIDRTPSTHGNKNISYLLFLISGKTITITN